MNSTAITPNCAKHVFSQKAGARDYTGGATAPPNGRVAAISGRYRPALAGHGRGGGPPSPSPVRYQHYNKQPATAGVCYRVGNGRRGTSSRGRWAA